MSKTASITTTWSISGDGLTGSDSATITNAASEAPTSLAFASASFSAVAIPTGALGVLIRPPPSNTQTLTIKGVTGDTGIPISASSPTKLDFTGIAAGGAVVVTLEWC